MAGQWVTSHLLFTACCVLWLMTSQAQNVFDCPRDWRQFNGYCYKLSGDVPAIYENASRACSTHGASLLYVLSQEENTFIRNTLDTVDTFQRSWLTSGRRSTTEGEPSPGDSGFVWEATSLQIPSTLTFWQPGQPDLNQVHASDVIAYTYGEVGYAWSTVSSGDAHPYVCKIDQAEAYRIVQTSRGFDYGLDFVDLNQVERGPHFVMDPHSVVVVSQTGQPAALECLANANPEPTYKWFRGDDFTEEVTTETSERYTLTNGRLSIEEPSEKDDEGQYRCQAHNKFGTIISSAVSLTFGSMSEFSNVQNDAVRAKAYEGVAIQCNKLNFKPAARYVWLKNERQFIRPDMQTYIFMSHNGKLYFSEVTDSDEGDYKCLAILTGLNQYTIGTVQPPGKLSPPIPLLVTKQAPKADWGPEIQNDFPAVFPQTPLRGQDVRIECFAYGTSNAPFHYSWTRSGKPIPASAETIDNDRVLVIHDAQLEDSGTYTCHVMRSTNARTFKSIHLSLAASPYFVSPLRDQHADVGSQITWHCDARANPAPLYTWYKNGQPLSTDPDQRIQVLGNILIISDLSASLHDGMYQCGAVNNHGSQMSNAQLRVLAFAPTFRKHPLPPQITASVAGDVTIICNPEGAPFPTITWQKNGGALTADGSHVTQLANGNLVIKDLGSSDGGTYTCLAENKFGQDSSSTLLVLAEGAFISQGPSPTTAAVNTSTFLPCQVSLNPNVDMTFVWYFNGYLIDTDLPEFTKVDTHPTGQTGLYIKNVQLKHQGRYRCSARTPFTEDSKQAFLTVKGPPGMPAGVEVDGQTVTQDSLSLRWTVGTNNGATIHLFRVEAEDEFNPGIWNIVVEGVRAQDTIRAVTEAETSKRRTEVSGLNPGTGYRFRVLAQNEFGLGVPSGPSGYVKTLDAPPALSPRNLRGGGGSVGDLTIQWDLLDRSEWGSSDLTYRVYWRLKTDSIDSRLWEKQEKAWQEDMHVVLVGQENYYILYEVKIQAVNQEGEGPNSTIVDVYSAEGMPPVSPTGVESGTLNSTALEVTWEPVPDTREAVRGKVKGYQINYWPEEMLASDYVRFIRYYGQVDNGLVIGLEVDVNTWVDVQVYNSAGLGPRSESYIMETSGDAPLTYPQEVRVYSDGPRRARVWWRGISIITDEEGMEGYVIYYWKANEVARTAVEVEVPLQTTEYVLTDLDENTLYALRIAGLNGGGYGRKSPTHYFTFEGSFYVDYSLSQTIDVFMAGATFLRPSCWLLLALLSMLTYLV